MHKIVPITAIVLLCAGTSFAITALPTKPSFHQEAVELIGASHSVALNPEQTKSEQVLALWQDFANLMPLHQAVNWNEPVDLYAYYTDFNTTMTKAKLTLGYDANQLNSSSTIEKLSVLLPVLNKDKIPEGEYQYYPVAGIGNKAVYKAWLNLPLDRNPKVVLEHYNLDEHGVITNIQLKIIEKQ